MSYDHVACFFGHRTINETEELKNELYKTIEKLITEEKVNTFLFGSKSRFNSLCLELVTNIKEKYPYIKRIYVRAEFPDISDSYRAYLMENYEDTYYPEKSRNAHKSVYIKRNYEMIDNSRFCVVYLDDACMPVNRKSGTVAALEYAVKLNREIIVFPSEQNSFYGVAQEK